MKEMSDNGAWAMLAAMGAKKAMAAFNEAQRRSLASSNFSISGWHWRMETISSNASESCSCNSKMIILPIISPPYLMFFSKRLITPGYSNVSMYSSKQIF